MGCSGPGCLTSFLWKWFTAIHPQASRDCPVGPVTCVCVGNNEDWVELSGFLENHEVGLF